MDKEPVRLIFTSFRDSRSIDGLKVSMDNHPPKFCSYPTLLYLVTPRVINLSKDNMERICQAILDNNRELIRDFISEVYGLGIRQIVFCDWATKEQISFGKPCMAGVIGQYIRNMANEFEFTIEIEYRDGRDVL